jgi:DinB family protein
MNRNYTLLFAAAITGACALQAHAADPLSTEARQAYNGIKNNLIKMAEKVPDDVYSFKATPEIRTFGQLVAHVADAQMGACSGVNGGMKSLGAASKTSKADLVAALKESSAECDKAFEALTDTTATQMIKTRRGERTKLGTLYSVIGHDNEEYGYMAVYLRLKSIVPPSSER